MAETVRAGGIKGNPDFDKFFDSNYELSYIDEFKELIEDKGMSDAGRIMWAVYMTEDPSSALYGKDKTMRRIDVAKNYLEDDMFDWDSIKHVIQAYKRDCLPKKVRMYADYIEMWNERHEYLKELSYKENAKDKDDMLLKSKKIWDELAKIEQEYIKEVEGGSRSYGGEEESAMDEGLI